MANTGSLLRLFQSEYFNAHLHMQYLHRRDEAGVQDYLVNELFKMTDDEVDFYLPQLCHAALLRYHKSSLHRFLLDKAAKSMHFALKIHWLVQSTVEDKLPDLLEPATLMASACSHALATAPLAVHLSGLRKPALKDANHHAAPPTALPEEHAVEEAPAMEQAALEEQSLRRPASLPDLAATGQETPGGAQGSEADELDLTPMVAQGSMRKCNSNSHLPEPSPTPSAAQALQTSSEGDIVKEKLNGLVGPPPGHGETIAHLRQLSEACPPERKLEDVGMLAHLPNIYAELGGPIPDGTAEAPTEAHAESHPQQSIVIRRRCEWFKLQNDFVAMVTKLSTSIVATADKAERKVHFKKCLRMMNSWLLQRRLYMALNAEGPLAFSGLHFPMLTRHDTNLQILRIVIDECRLFSSATRAPFLLTYEVANLDEVNQQGTSDSTPVCRQNSRGSLPHVPHMASEAQLTVGVESIEDPDSMVVLSRSVIAMLHSCVTCELEAAKQLLLAASNSAGDTADEVASAPTTRPSSDSMLHSGQMQALRRQLMEVSSEEWLRLEPSVELGSSAVPEEVVDEEQTKQERRSATPPYGDPVQRREAPKVRQEIWGELWADRVQRIREASPFGHYPSWAVHGAVVKGGDDLRQELLAAQVFKQFKDIWSDAGLPLWLRDMEVLVVSSSAGFIEFISDAQALDGIKKKYAPKTLGEIFQMAFADKLYEAKRNFIESMAAYNLVVYFLQVKDRHNGNLMLDCDGHIIHIDFGFMLSNSPGGNTNFEQSPFKLTQEFLDVMDGEYSDQFEYFRTLIIRGFLEARKHVERIILPIRMMLVGSKFPCFREGPDYILRTLHSRFLPDMSEEACISKIVELIDHSVNNWRTIQYDKYQRIVNGIL